MNPEHIKSYNCSNFFACHLHHHIEYRKTETKVIDYSDQSQQTQTVQ